MGDNKLTLFNSSAFDFVVVVFYGIDDIFPKNNDYLEDDFYQCDNRFAYIDKKKYDERKESE